MKDWRGTEINIGSRVVYPTRRRSSMWMAEGEVVDFSEQHIEKFGGAHWWERKITVKSSDGRRRFPAAERVTVINPPLELPLKI